MEKSGKTEREGEEGWRKGSQTVTIHSLTVYEENVGAMAPKEKGINRSLNEKKRKAMWERGTLKKNRKTNNKDTFCATQQGQEGKGMRPSPASDRLQLKSRLSRCSPKEEIHLRLTAGGDKKRRATLKRKE